MVAQDRKCLIHETPCEFLAFCVGAVIWPPLARARPETKIDVSARTALRKRPFLEASGGKRFLCPSEKVLVAGWRAYNSHIGVRIRPALALLMLKSI